MRQEDIRLNINGREAGQFCTIGGTPPDLSFFEYNRQYFAGEHTIGLYVGNAYVSSKVRFSGFNVSVDTAFSPPAIDRFVEVQKQRIEAEQLQAQFEDRISDVFYLSAETLLKARRFPEFDIKVLSKDPDGEKFFVSHRWQTSAHPDPEGKHLELLQKHAERHRSAHYWVDFSSLPQPRLTSDTKLFEKTLPKIASIQSEASTVVIMDGEYSERLWCFVEHYIAIMFSQSNFGVKQRSVEYLGEPWYGSRDMAARVQALREPEWERLRVTKQSDIPFIKANYVFLANVVKFQLVDRFIELFREIPGINLYCAQGHFPQSVFGLSYSDSLDRIASMYSKFQWRREELYREDALNRVAALLAHSRELDAYTLQGLRFSEYLFYDERIVAYVVMLLAVIQEANRSQLPLRNLRTLFARILLMSMIR
jgi:hypothetical protein